ncbi:MAG: methionine gamma-lyase family protein [Oscillospiraceae bacterium]|nr:methionine gamma-lyase family protein [Oscillospiraceae bacterium]
MSQFVISNKILELSQAVQADISPQFELIDEITLKNTEKVLSAFQKHRVSDTMFAGSTGYGYNDKGRETLDLVFAEIMKTESALVREGFVSGTHAITAMLFATLRPGQTLLSVAGIPYDTLHGVIGITGNYSGSLKDYNISYSQIELLEDGSPDLKAISQAVKSGNVGAVLIQRSRGYSSRRALSVSEIGEICDCVCSSNKNVRIMVDNCYGEFVEIIEPGDVGADILAGSLIKNPGGGIAPTGGYVAGREELVNAAANRLTAPGIGDKCGSEQGGHRLLYQGLFLAPHTVAQALKTAAFAARLFEKLGYKTHPCYNDKRSDIIQMISLLSPDALLRFCEGIQAAAPVDSYVTPIAGDMPGYEHKVVMAAGTFIQGASIELSADAPMREPYNVFLQGGLTYESGKLGVMLAASYLLGN